MQVAMRFLSKLVLSSVDKLYPQVNKPGADQHVKFEHSENVGFKVLPKTTLVDLAVLVWCS